MITFKQFLILEAIENGLIHMNDLAHKYTKNQFKPDIGMASSLTSSEQKQKPIGKAFEMAISDHPEYKKRVFNAYQKQHSDLIKQSGATDYDSLKHASYSQMSKETNAQYEHMKAHSHTFDFHNGDNDYKDSDAMRNDLHTNKHLNVFKGGEVHDKLGQEDENGLSHNDKFRAVHDAFGHGLMKNGFGPKGEEHAWGVHSQMYSPLAKLAMSAETRGQNSYVNYSGVNNHIQKQSNILKNKMKEPGANIEDLKQQHSSLMKNWNYAPNKSALLPPEMNRHNYKGETPGYLKDIMK